MNQITEAEAKSSYIDGWWYILACLPIAYAIQIMSLLSLSRDGAAMADAAMWIDIGIFLRSISGLIWQPRSRDWRFYFGVLFACIPLIWCIYFLWAFAVK
jgi:hypothetical protein